MELHAEYTRRINAELSGLTPPVADPMKVPLAKTFASLSSIWSLENKKKLGLKIELNKFLKGLVPSDITPLLPSGSRMKYHMEY